MARPTQAVLPAACEICGKPSPEPKCVECIAAVERFRFDWEYACATLHKIEHRDRAGMLVSFTFNDAQTRAVHDIYRILFLEILMQYDAGLRGEPVYIEDVVGRVDRGETIFPWEVGLRLLIGKSRRRGISALIQALGLIFMAFHGHYTVCLMAHNEKTAEEIGRMGRRYYNNWTPEYRHLRLGNVHNSTERLELTNESRRQVFTAGVKGSAKGKGKEESRGWHFNFYHFSEYAHYQTYSEAIACGAVAPANAWIIKESTGNGPSGPFYQEWNAAMSIDEAEQAWMHQDAERLSSWGMPKHQYKVFFSWLDDPGLTAAVSPWEHASLDKLDEYETSLRKLEPLKFTRNKIKWRRATIARDCTGHSLAPEAYFAQEWPATETEMFQATGTKVYSRYGIMATFEVASKVSPLLRCHFDGYTPPKHALYGNTNLALHVRAKPGHKYIIGADASQGMGQDYHWAFVADRHDGTFFEEVCSFWDRTMDAKAFGHVCTFLAEYFNGAFIAPELQGGGLACSMTIVEDNRYTKVYKRENYGQLGITEDNVFRYGIFSSQQVKSAMVQNTRAIFDAKNALIRTPLLIRQLRAYECIDGKYGKPEGEDDDGVDAVHLTFFGARRAPPIKGFVENVVERAIDLAAEELGLSKSQRAMVSAVQAKIGKSMKSANRMRNGVRQAFRGRVDKTT